MLMTAGIIIREPQNKGEAIPCGSAGPTSRGQALGLRGPAHGQPQIVAGGLILKLCKVRGACGCFGLLEQSCHVFKRPSGCLIAPNTSRPTSRTNTELLAKDALGLGLGYHTMQVSVWRLRVNMRACLVFEKKQAQAMAITAKPTALRYG